MPWNVWTSEISAPFILIFGSRWRWVIGFTLQPLYPRDNIRGTHCMGDWVVCRTWRRKILLFLSPSRESNHISSVLHFLDYRYTNYTLHASPNTCSNNIIYVSAVLRLGFVSGCRLEGTGIESLQEPQLFAFSKTSRPDLWPTQPPTCSVPGHEDDHSRLSRAEDKNEWICTSFPATWFHAANREDFSYLPWSNTLRDNSNTSSSTCFKSPFQADCIPGYCVL